MDPERSTKIVATLGPASSSRERMLAMVDAGVDVFRFNLAHGTHDEHRHNFALLRAIEEERGQPIGVLMDLQGPKIRIGTFAHGRVVLQEGQPFVLDLDPTEGDEQRVHLPHPEVFAVIEPGQKLLLSDGRIRLRVEEKSAERIETVVEVGGPLADRQGVNVPDVVLPIPALTEKDMRDLSLALELGADWIALSFVQRPEDVIEARKLIMGRAAVMAKIEKPAAIEHLDEIVQIADGVMSARGDLGVELPAELVPGLQKKIIRRCRHFGRPVVVATQMLDSMVESPAPTRAEASDVATAVYDGADAVMLSQETARGRYPVLAVRMMARIVRQVEHDEFYRSYLEAYRAEVEPRAADAITMAAGQVAHVMSAACIVTFTTSGATALRASRERPDRPILGLVTRTGTARKLTLAWGVHPVLSGDVEDIDDMVDRARRFARETGFAEPGKAIVITAGMPFGTPGATNLLRVAWVT